MAPNADLNIKTGPTGEESDIDWIPEGYVRVFGPDNQFYVVPDFMVPALHQTFDGYRNKSNLSVHAVAGQANAVSYCPTVGHHDRPATIRHMS